MNSAALKKISWAVGLSLVLVVGAVLFFCDPVRVPIYPQCVFHRVTGLDCPGCGSLRALHALLHGEFRTAVRFNAFLVWSLPLLAGLGLYYAGRRIQARPRPRFRAAWVWLYFGAYLAFGVLRNLPGPLFAAFAP